MILIAHRGNTTGPNIEKENHPDYIDEAIKKGFDVEVDIRGNLFDGLWLGHDEKQYEVKPEWVFQRVNNLWLHAKDIEALHTFTQLLTGLNCFWHEEDCYTLTTSGYIWTYPGKKLTPSSICVMPEIVPNFYSKEDLEDCYGICTDYVERYK
jgi:hypothetical protein